MKNTSYKIMYSLEKSSLTSYSVPGAMLGPGNPNENREMWPCPHAFTVEWGKPFKN